MSRTAARAELHGAVQGVGFRPAVYRVAASLGLEGRVSNTTGGALVEVWDADPAEAMAGLRGLIGAIGAELPAQARIDSVSYSTCPAPHDAPRGFVIAASSSEAAGGVAARVTPDVAICPRCLADFNGPGRRHDYPLTNCTECGPRYTITRALPYDRPLTSMAPFAMCDDCAREYADPADRRFHAQPVACPACGPSYTLRTADGAATSDFAAIASSCADMLRAGKIIMVKGMGGYNLMCDATSPRALDELRRIKRRPRKPFAVMTADMESARRLVRLDAAEERILRSWRAPIVIARMAEEAALPPQVAPGCTTLGVMLPHMAFQHRVCGLAGIPVALTSANRPGCPMITDDAEARAYADSLALPLVSYNREIVARVDDSVTRLVDGSPQLLRRSRGYVPEPIGVGGDCRGLVAAGADVTSACAVGSGSDAVVSPYIGSLTSQGGVDALEEAMHHLTALLCVRPEVVAVDMHPAYESSRLGREWAAAHGARVELVQHHHAHAAAVMAEYGLTGPVVAVVLDGTGYGPDATVWGAELLVCDRPDYVRAAHAPYMALPGGDMASREPWRMAVSAVAAAGLDPLASLPEGLMQAAGGRRAVSNVMLMMERGINSPQGCGMGRLFDAVAALLGLAYTNGYEAEAPVLLENAAMRHGEADPYDTTDPADPTDWRPMLRRVLSDIRAGVAAGEIAARFHATLAESWALAAAREASRRRLDTVVLAGGVMQNATLATRMASALRRRGLTAVMPLRMPAGDGAIALGQLTVAAARRHAAKSPQQPSFLFPLQHTIY